MHHAKEADCILQRGLTVSCEENEILPTKLIDGILQRGLSYRDYMNRLRWLDNPAAALLQTERRGCIVDLLCCNGLVWLSCVLHFHRELQAPWIWYYETCERTAIEK